MLWLEKPHIRECVAGGLWLVKQMQEGSDWDPSHGLLSTWPWAKLGCGSISLPCVCTESRVSSSPGHCQGLSGQGLLGRCQCVPAKLCSQEQISKTPKGNANGLPKRNQQFLIHAAMWDGDLYLITVFFHSVRVYWEKSTAGLSESSDTSCRKLAPKVYFTMFKFVVIHTAEKSYIFSSRFLPNITSVLGLFSSLTSQQGFDCLPYPAVLLSFVLSEWRALWMEYHDRGASRIWELIWCPALAQIFCVAFSKSLTMSMLYCLCVQLPQKGDGYPH